MKKFLLIIFAFLTLPISAQAQQSDIIISAQWARPILIAGRPGSAYFQIENKSAEADRLLSVTSSVSPRLEIHEHTMKDGVMKMGRVDAIDVPAGGSVELKPGGYHIMIFESTKKYAPGDEIDLTLHFENAGAIEKTVSVMTRQP